YHDRLHVNCLLGYLSLCWICSSDKKPVRHLIGNKPDKKPRRYAWDVYRTGGRSRWVGRVIASTADKAIWAAGKLVLALAMTQPTDGTLDLRCATSCAAAGSGSPSVS